VLIARLLPRMVLALMIAAADVPVGGGCCGSGQLSAPRPRPLPPPPPADTAPVPVPAQGAACPPWGGAPLALTTHSWGAIGPDDLQLSYDEKTGVVAVVDADLHAEGQEAPRPRVPRARKTLSAAERDALGRDLRGICPSAAELGRRCAPGGCTSVMVSWPGGQTTVEDSATVARVAGLLSAFFPELSKGPTAP